MVTFSWYEMYHEYMGAPTGMTNCTRAVSIAHAASWPKGAEFEARYSTLIGLRSLLGLVAYADSV